MAKMPFPLTQFKHYTETALKNLKLTILTGSQPHRKQPIKEMHPFLQPHIKTNLCNIESKLKKTKQFPELGSSVYKTRDIETWQQIAAFMKKFKKKKILKRK